MKCSALTVLAGLTGSLLAGHHACGAFAGLVVSDKSPADTSNWADQAVAGHTIFVCNVSMQFTGPLDVGAAVFGMPNSPMQIGVTGNGVFYQQTLFGSDVPPNAGLFPAFPSLEFDSFVTFNYKTSQQGPPPNLSPGWPGFGPGMLGGTNLAWFITPGTGQGVPNAAGQVLIAQLSIDVTANPGATGISGTMNVEWMDSTGQSFQQIVAFDHPIPAPSALALLGAAGLVGRRRRRRTK